LKVSIVTACRNADRFLKHCIESVLNQSYPDIEYIVVDGASTDDSLLIIKNYEGRISRFISQKDEGIYDAMNKGIALAGGDIVGILNADDFFPHPGIVKNIISKFEESKADAVYGDIWYVDKENISRPVRKWRSGTYRHGFFQWGWMPPHPSFYARRELFEKYGSYDLSFGSASDYELMLRFIHKHKIKTAYLPQTIVKMRTGGVSNSSLKNRLDSSRNDLRAMRRNGIVFPELAALLKPLRKLPQFLS